MKDSTLYTLIIATLQNVEKDEEEQGDTVLIAAPSRLPCLKHVT